MKIIIHHEDLKTTVEDPDVIDICEALDLVERGLEEIGFSTERIQGAIHRRGKEIATNLGLD